VDPNAVLDSLDRRYKYLAPVWNRTVTYVTLAGSLAAVPDCVSVRCEEKRKQPQGMKRWQPSFNEPSPLDWNPMPFFSNEFWIIWLAVQRGFKLATLVSCLCCNTWALNESSNPDWLVHRALIKALLSIQRLTARWRPHTAPAPHP
jgi:hypothetical protein